jgi:2-dehydro-3-deoxyphosphogluconate aldolase / (4S)-4-hydroxy-2-oxoglutarate aldolase
MLAVLPAPGQTELNESRPAIPPSITGSGVIAIARRVDPATIRTTCDALLEGGIRAFELTLNEPEGMALESLSAAVRHLEGSPLVVGAGTVLSIDAARRAIDAGGAFLVAPHVDTEVVAWALERGIPMFPGAATPTEALTAWRAGAAGVKVFPASSLGTSFVREMRGPFPDLPMIPTGGISAENAAAYVDAGAVAVGIGSWLFGGGSAASIADRSRLVVDAVAKGRRTRAAIRS